MPGKMILGSPSLMILLLAPVLAMAEAQPEMAHHTTFLQTEDQPANAAAIEAKTALLGKQAPTVGVENQGPVAAALPEEQESDEADETANEPRPEGERLASTGRWIADAQSDRTSETDRETAPAQAAVLPVSNRKSNPWQLMIVPAAMLLVFCLYKLRRGFDKEQIDPDRLAGPMGKRVKVVCGKDTEAAIRKLSTRLLGRKPRIKP